MGLLAMLVLLACTGSSCLLSESRSALGVHRSGEFIPDASDSVTPRSLTPRSEWSHDGARSVGHDEVGAALTAAIDQVATRPTAGVPRNAALIDEIDGLIERADQGDSAAACRLAWDLDLCSRASKLPALQQEWLDSSAAERPHSQAEAESAALLQRVDAWARRASVVCVGLPDDYLRETANRMYRSASLGNATSMARFALAPPFGEMLSLEQAELIDVHRRNALQFLERAALAGEPTGLYGVFVANARGYIPTQYGNLPISPDPVQAVAAGTALLRFADPNTAQWIREVLAQLHGSLPSDSLSNARSLTDTYEQRFSAQVPRDFASGIFGPDIGETCVDPDK